MGYVAESSTRSVLAALPGDIAIGHTRYSTAGDSRLTNAQPILIDCAMARSPSRTTATWSTPQELRDELVRQGSIFQTTSDTEVILHLYARSRAATLEDAIIEAISQVQGAFSLVLLDARTA